MYKRILLLALALFMGGAASAWKIEGRIANVTDRDTVLVTCHQFFGNYGKRIGLDTLRSDGRFTFSGSHPKGELILMSVSSGDLSYDLWVTDSSDIRVSGAAGGPWRIVSNEPEQAVQGEIDAVDLSDLTALTRTKDGYWKYRDSVWRASVERLWPVYIQHPDSPAMHDDLGFYLGVGAVSQDKLQSLYRRLSAESKTSRFGQSVAVGLESGVPVPAVGDVYADFAALDTAGVRRRLSDYMSPGKYTLLDIWSAGCKGCLAAFPELKKIHGQYADRLTIVGVSYDTDPGVWRRAVVRWELPWSHLSDGMGTGGPFNARYKVTVEPTYVLIDPSGRIVDRWYGGQGDLQSRLVRPHLDPSAQVKP